MPFEDLRNQVRALWYAENHDQAIALLEAHRHRYDGGYPDFTIHYYLGLLHAETGALETSLATLHAGMDRGYFYAFFPWFLEKIQGTEGADAFLQRNDRLRQAARDTARVRFEVQLPEGFDPDEAYPLLLFLHGNNSSLDGAKAEWDGVHLDKPFIVAFLQSSSPASSFAYSWPDAERSRQDVQEAYEQLQSRHTIDEDTVLLAGFSAGGRVAIDVLLQQRLPAAGFIAFSPPKAEAFSDALITRAMKAGKRGALITGEDDYLLPQQVEMAHRLIDHGFPLRLVVQTGQGHGYPKDFAPQLDQSINHVLHAR